MSRAPPFPTRRRSPSVNGTSISSPNPFSPTSSGTKPLQISRPNPERSTTPGNASFPQSSPRTAPPDPASSGPSRPQRSELRTRVSDYDNSEQASFRDSISTTRSDVSLSQLQRAGASGSPTTPAKSRPRPQRLQSPIDEGELSTPTSLVSAVSAFKSAGSRRRAMTNGSDEMQYQTERQNEMEAEKVRQQRIRDKVPGRRVNGKARAGDIDAVLEQVKDGWEFIIDPDFNNVDLALQLLDDSSHGKDMESFRRTKEMLGKALKGSVDKHYQAFAASLPHQAALLGHLGETQSQIHAARTALLEAKDALGNKRADLVQLWSRGQTLEEMLRILDQIEHLKSVPDLLETLMSEKRLLQAAVLLVRSLKIINKPDMLEIGAVSDLRSYLVSQETALRDILTDELQNHLYLKSFWCDTRWAAYVPNQQTFLKIEFEEEAAYKTSDPAEATPTSPSFRPSRQARFLQELAIKPNEPPIDLSDLSVNNGGQASTSTLTSVSNTAPHNPEADSFAYMETLIESLAVLGKLGSALDNVAQRLPSEIFNLVETTLNEVEERAEYGRRATMFGLNGTIGRSEGPYIFASEHSAIGPMTLPKGAFVKASSLRLAALESSSKRVDHEILKDLFWTLYSKLDAVAQGLRVVYEVANRVGSRRDFKDSSGTKPGSLFPLAEVWAPVQTEVRTLIHDYLTDEDQGSVSGRNPISSINEILREGKFTRDRSKGVFRFADTDMKMTSKALRQHEDGLTRVLNDTMPGLVPGSGDAVQATLASVGTDDRMLGADQHHRLLIRPDAFHVSVLFQPTLAFLSRIAAVFPFGVESERTSSAVLDEFVLKVYLPQLEEKVSDLFHQTVTGPEAFQPDPLSRLLSPEPLMKSSTELMALINSLCAMLATSPFHRENYSRLILGVIIQFYQRCSDRFQDLVTIRASQESKLEPKLALSAQWAQRSEVTPCTSELLSTPEEDTGKLQQLCRQETNLELELLGRKAIPPGDLIPSIRNIAALALLYRSVSWFATEINTLKARPDDGLSPTTPQNLEPLSGATPYTPYAPLIFPQEQLKLPLSREMSLRFQALLKTYEQLSGLILDSIRIDVRCRTISYLESAMRQGDYSIDSEASEPDPHIVDLNAELVKCDDFLSTSLPKRERQFAFVGLGQLMEHLLVTNAKHLRFPTSFGIKKIMRNILALQQSIKALTNDQQNTEFERAKLYYSLFFSSPRVMLDGVRSQPSFTFDEYQTMLNLQCGVDPVEGEAGVAKATDRNYSMYMIELHGLELESSGP
ncbi:putative vacuolar-sorting protein 54, of GARP complex [Lyophyllum shimeji]|uniref:Exocyst complex component Sec8 n=1 Tax=Lyophyllum shimeji TaxID=47721 RepID=A0A9P3UK23_LYOSH|nr:putative vacuolar-sorting protein 54, of GARP complex [Lyophyllum shimeji]